jgi:RNA polymerase sigma-70 factor (ECF subfamily)
MFLAVLSRVASEPADGGLPDEVLVGRLADGDKAAAGALYDRYARLVYSLILRIVQDEGDAEDLLQDVFVQAWQQASRFDRTRGAVAAWLLTIARSRALDRLRSRRSRPETGTAAIDAIQPAAAPAVASEDAIAVRRALAEMPLLPRVALELAYFEGLSHTEIAERLGEPLGTVKTRIRTGLLKLRSLLAPGATGMTT